MNLKELVLKNRSYRRFDETKKISMKQLEDWTDLGRLSPCGMNRQGLKFALIANEKKNLEVFNTLVWAGYLSDWDGPTEGERPTGYIIVLRDARIAPNSLGDEGYAVQSILLGAVEAGYGGCTLGAIDRLSLVKELGLPDYLEIVWVLALGVPNEEIEIVSVKEDIKYYRDAQGKHYVPKRSLEDVISIRCDE